MKDDTTGRVLRLELLIDGMLAVHAKHALYTALAGVEGVRGAVVELGRAELELALSPEAVPPRASTDSDATALSGLSHAARQQLAEAVALVGCSIRELRVLPRSLPTL